MMRTKLLECAAEAVSPKSSRKRMDELWSWLWRHRLTMISVAFLPAALWLLMVFYYRDDPPLPWYSNKPLSRVILKNAASNGAVCLDGSPPGFHFRKGVDSGANRWILFLEGGGWCYTKSSCVQRSLGFLGTSKQLSKTVKLHGMFSSKKTENPDFFNWNVAYLHYCDGASFIGDVDEPVIVEGKRIFFRGRRILDSVIDYLIDERGLNYSSHVLIGGCSAGGLATYLNCDYIRSRLPADAAVKCLADAGMFLDIPDIDGTYTIQPSYEQVFKMQNVIRSVSKSCLKSQSPESAYKCLFGQNLLPHMQTPFFVLNSEYDTWSLANILVPESADPEGEWSYCISEGDCDDAQQAVLRGFRANMLRAIQPAVERGRDGVFAYRDFYHCVAYYGSLWQNLRIGEEVLRDAVGSWFFERKLNATWVQTGFPDLSSSSSSSSSSH